MQKTSLKIGLLIKNIVKKENPNIKEYTKVILLGIAVYGKMPLYAEKSELIFIGTRGK
jgi:hypothetical protein